MYETTDNIFKYACNIYIIYRQVTMVHGRATDVLIDYWLPECIAITQQIPNTECLQRM